MAGTIRDVADYLETEAGRATERGEHESAVSMLKAALMVRAALDLPAAREVLHGSKYSPKVSPMAMGTDHREAISKGRAKRNPLMRAARERGIPTMDALCDALKSAAKADRIELKVSPSFLSQIVSKTKKLPPDLGRYLLALTGWEP